MIGLLFFGAIAVWAVIALVLGRKLPQWLGITRHRTVFSFVFALLVFVAPVADEIIAYPQMQALCTQVHSYKFVEGMNAEKASGRTIYYASRSTRLTSIFPSSVETFGNEMGYFDAKTREPILYRYSISVHRGWLGIPAGSSGTAMTVLLKGCYAKDGAVNNVSTEYDAKGVPRLLSTSNITQVSSTADSTFNMPERSSK